MRNSRSSKRALAAPFLLALLLPLAGGGGAPAAMAQDGAKAGDETTEKPSSFVERSTVELVQIEAVVLDRRGRHIRNLPRGRFQMTVGKQPVEIVTFDEIDLARAEGDAVVLGGARKESPDVPPTPATTPVPGEATPPPAEASLTAAQVSGLAGIEQDIEARLRGPRWFVMVFDGYNNVSPLRMSQARRAARKWVDESMRPRDRVAVFEFNPYLAAVSGFSSDADEIKESISKTRMFPADNMGSDLIGQRLEQGGAMPREILESQLLNAAEFGNDLLRAERDQFYSNVSSLGEVLSGLSGTKSVMVFSGGFPITRTRSTAARGGFTPRFKEMLAILEAYGVRVFSFDIGVEGGFTDADKAVSTRIALDDLGLGTEWLDSMQIGAQTNSTNAHQEILHVLGNETGGRFWRGKDYASGIKAADDDLSHYYLIGFRPLDRDQLVAQGKKAAYLPIKIKIDDENYRVISRKGRFTDSQASLAERRRKDEERRAWADSQLETGDDLNTVTPLSVRCYPQFYPSDSGMTLVVFAIHIDGPIDPVSVGGGNSALDLDITIGASYPDETVQRGERNVRLSFPNDAAQFLAGGLQIRDAMLLPPTLTDLSAQVRINGMNRSGRWTETVNIPDRGRGHFGLTELALLHPSAPTPLIYDIFRKGDDVYGTEPPRVLPDPLGTDSRGRPPLYLEGAFSRATPLLAQVQVTSPPAATAAQTNPLLMDWELLPLTGGESILPPVTYRRLQMVEAQNLLDVVVDLKLDQIEPGDYTLRLTATNLVENSTDVRSFPITISE